MYQRIGKALEVVSSVKEATLTTEQVSAWKNVSGHRLKKKVTIEPKEVTGR